MKPFVLEIPLKPLKQMLDMEHGKDEEFLVRTVGRYDFKGKSLEYTTEFYPNRFVVLYKDRKMGEIPYKGILQVIKNRESLRFNLDDGSYMKIPCSEEEKRDIFRIFKMKRLGVTCLNSRSIIGLALVEFSNLQFLIPIDTTSFMDFKKKAIKRIGFHFFPSQNLDFVSLEHYDELGFYIRNGESSIMLENDDDLTCALLYFNKRLDVAVKQIAKES